MSGTLPPSRPLDYWRPDMTAAEIAYLEELPPEFQTREYRPGGRFADAFVETRGRHRCPTCNCFNTVRYGNVVCAWCWKCIPEPKRAIVTEALRLREDRPEVWAQACEVVLQLAQDHAAPNCRTRAASSTSDRSPESEPAPQEERSA